MPNNNLLEEISAHIQSLGFTVNVAQNSKGDPTYRAVPQAEGKPEFTFWEYSAGVIFMAGFISTVVNPEGDSLERFQWLNAVSENLFVSRLVWVTDGGIFSEASYPTVYDRDAFDLFLARWFYEIDSLFADKANVEKFLGTAANLDA